MLSSFPQFLHKLSPIGVLAWLAAGICVFPELAPARLRAQDAVLANLSNLPRKQWVDVALPAADAASLPRLCRFEPNGWIAYKGREVGLHSVVFHILADLAPQQRVSGQLVGVSNNVSTFAPWGMSDWVADDAPGVLPMPAIMDAQGIEHRLQNPRLELVEDVSPARRVFRLWGRMGSSPMVYDAYLYVYAGQDVVPFEASFFCSDPRLAAMSFDWNFLWIESGEYLQVEYRTRLGMAAPMMQTSLPSHPSFGRWVQMVSGPRTIGRGEGLHLSGAMLCMIAPGRTPAPVSYGTHGMVNRWTVPDRIDQLSAEYQFPCLGQWQHWDGKWLAFGMVPELPVNLRADRGVADSNATWNSFRSLLQQPADLYVQRPRGLFRNAASTGAQEDFGACKGALAVAVGDPRWQHDAGYSVAEVVMRAFHYREVDGSQMRKANYPSLQFFNQYPNCRTTGTSLGYPCPLPYVWPTTFWTTWDDQHRSHNNFLALLALSGRYALRTQLVDLAEVDKAMVPNWMDEPRAEGRLCMAWANMYLLLDTQQERAELLATMLQRLQTVLNRWPGRHFVNNPAKPIRALSVGSDPTFLEPGGARVPAIVTWEHSIAVMGFFAAWRVTGDSRYRDLAREVGRMIVNHCCFVEAGRWRAATAVRYLQGAQEGDALPASTYYTGSPDVHVSLNFWPWILPSVLVTRELYRGQDAALVARCDAILQDVAPQGPTNWLDAEWWAVLPR